MPLPGLASITEVCVRYVVRLYPHTLDMLPGSAQQQNKPYKNRQGSRKLITMATHPTISRLILSKWRIKQSTKPI